MYFSLQVDCRFERQRSKDFRERWPPPRCNPLQFDGVSEASRVSMFGIRCCRSVFWNDRWVQDRYRDFDALIEGGKDKVELWRMTDRSLHGQSESTRFIFLCMRTSILKVIWSCEKLWGILRGPDRSSTFVGLHPLDITSRRKKRYSLMQSSQLWSDPCDCFCTVFTSCVVSNTDKFWSQICTDTCIYTCNLPLWRQHLLAVILTDSHLQEKAGSKHGSVHCAMP